jgi:hypothetical protein
MTTLASQPSASDLFRAPFIPTVVFVKETPDFHTRLCIYNYYSELLPHIRTGATAHLWFFRDDGSFVAKREIALLYKGQLQFDLATLGIAFQGTAGLSLIPETMPEKYPSAMGSGYYAQYSDNRGHMDYSHEWEAMKFTPFDAHPWLCVVRPELFPDTKIILMNSYYGTEQVGSAVITVRLRSGDGRLLSERQIPPIPPRGSRVIPLDEVNPDVVRLAQEYGIVAVEAIGPNLQGPFTWVTNTSGDFNIHHFC